MRVLMVTHYFEAHRGGIEIVAGHLARELLATGVGMTWAAGAVDAAPEVPGLGTIGLPVWNGIENATGLPVPILGPGALRMLAKAVADADAVIVHEGLYMMSIAALAIARRKQVPVIIVQHVAAVPFSNPALRMLMAIANRIVVRPALAISDQVVFISEAVRTYYRDVTFRSPPVTVFNGVDTDVFHPPGSEERAALRQRFGVADNKQCALFVGRFVEKKGLAHIRSAAQALPGTIFLLAGWGAIDPESWGIGNVQVMRGRAGDSLAELYGAADILILPSVGEGFPLVVQEALACGLPVITGRDTTLADPAATQWLTAIDIDADNVDATGTRLAAALRDAATMSRANVDARSRFARQRYSWATTAARYRELLCQLVERRIPHAVNACQTVARIS